MSARPAVNRGRSKRANRIGGSVPGARVRGQVSDHVSAQGTPGVTHGTMRPWPVWFSVPRRRLTRTSSSPRCARAARCTDRGCTCRRRPSAPCSRPASRSSPSISSTSRSPGPTRRDRRDRDRRACRWSALSASRASRGRPASRSHRGRLCPPASASRRTACTPCCGARTGPTSPASAASPAGCCSWPAASPRSLAPARAAAAAAAAAPRTRAWLARRRRRAVRARGDPLGVPLMTTHAPRWTISGRRAGHPARGVRVDAARWPLVRAAAQRRRRAAGPRLRRQPRARRRPRRDARPPRLRRARARPPRQRRERRPLQRARRQRAAGGRAALDYLARGPAIPGSPASASRSAARCCSRRPRGRRLQPSSPTAPPARGRRMQPTTSIVRGGVVRGISGMRPRRA